MAWRFFFLNPEKGLFFAVCRWWGVDSMRASCCGVFRGFSQSGWVGGGRASVVTLQGMVGASVVSTPPTRGDRGLLEQLTRPELCVRVREQAQHIVALSARIDDLTARNTDLAASNAHLGAKLDAVTARNTDLATTNAALVATNAQLVSTNVELTAAHEDLSARLARYKYLFSRNSGNSSLPPSSDDMVGRTPPVKPTPPLIWKRHRGKQPGAAGKHLGWTDKPDRFVDRFPTGVCGCGRDLGEAMDVGITDSYQQHDIPRVTVAITQYDQHRVCCGCGRVHIAARPEGPGGGLVGYGPNLQTLAGYLLVYQHLPVSRVAAVLAALTGRSPSVGFIHGLLARIAAGLEGAEARIRALITHADAVCVDETPIRVGPAQPAPGRKKAQKYLLVAATEKYTSYVVGDRDLDTFTHTVIPDLGVNTVMVHDRYANYDSSVLGLHTHQLCIAHLLRDLAGVGEVYPAQKWPSQIGWALQALVHQAKLARTAGAESIDAAVRDRWVTVFRDGVHMGLHHTTTKANRGGRHRPGVRKARLLLEVLRDREVDVLRFAHHLGVPPTSNQAERDLRPAKIQQKISGRLTSLARTRERYRIRGYLSTAAKHGHNPYDVLYQAITATPWIPPDPAPT